MSDVHLNSFKLPVFRTVGHAYSLTFANGFTVLRLSWVWLIVLTAAIAALSMLTWPAHHAATVAGEFSMPLLEVFGPMLLSTAIGVSIAVGWNRFILLGQSPTAAVYARFDAVVVRYLLLSLGLLLPFAILLAIPASVWTTTPLMAGLVALLWFAAWIFGALRLGLALPAIALERSEIGLTQSYRATAGNFWRLFWSGAFLVIPITIVSVLPAVIFGTVDPQAETFSTYLASSLLGEASGLLFGILAVTLLSLQFRHFFSTPSEIA